MSKLYETAGYLKKSSPFCFSWGLPTNLVWNGAGDSCLLERDLCLWGWRVPVDATLLAEGHNCLLELLLW